MEIAKNRRKNHDKLSSPSTNEPNKLKDAGNIS